MEKAKQTGYFFWTHILEKKESTEIFRLKTNSIWITVELLIKKSITWKYFFQNKNVSERKNQFFKDLSLNKNLYFPNNGAVNNLICNNGLTLIDKETFP